ncbi:MAG: glycoside hydrolase family 2 TIM barrel-domain containing protein [Chthoniobacteraceae bacterium]
MKTSLISRLTLGSLLLASLALLPAFALAASQTVTIPDVGWHLWPDTKAEWKSDPIFLPNDVQLDKLPVNAPTGGWAQLNGKTGVTVTLPATVEQYFWGKLGWHPYGKDYKYGDSDPEVQNGNYEGVSWWWQSVSVPKSFAGRKVLLKIRGERLRAEVFVNQKLVGYFIVNEVPFECDVSKVIRPGQLNQLAIRITNPGGEMDWIDTQQMTWGGQSFQKSHGFGGLDRAITFTAYDEARLADAWVLNTPRLQTVQPHALVHNDSEMAFDGKVRFTISDRADGHEIASVEKPVQLAPGAEQSVQAEISDPTAVAWSPAHPRLYKLSATLVKGQAVEDRRELSFGFRWFAADGIGTNAVLRLNGDRIRLYSSISWGFWGFNGLFPTPALAEKEVRTARALGLNTLQFHRNPGKPEVLDAQDRLGLLRYCEPGGGVTSIGNDTYKHGDSTQGPVDLSGNGADPQNFAQRYLEEKIVRMVRALRSHPSLVMYCLQNEMTPDLHNPRIAHVLRLIHTEDPSRIVIMKSGIEPNNQCWMQPYDDTIYHDDGTGYSGWRDEHTVGWGKGVWKDSMYVDADHFLYATKNQREIIAWGEMGGSATPDNHAEMVKQIEQGGGQSYDLQDHQAILAAYDQFLTRWGFRQAFPTADQLFRAIGDKGYETWGLTMDAARLAEATDFFVLSGWESTAVENHSGLVDNQRNPKGDPALIHAQLAPVLPVVQLDRSTVEPGATVTADLYFLNETTAAVKGTLDLVLRDATGKETKIGSYPVPAWQRDQFVYPIASKVSVTLAATEGTCTVRLELQGETKATNQRQIYVINPSPALPKQMVIEVDGQSNPATRALAKLPFTVPAKNPAPDGNLLVITGSKKAPLEITDDMLNQVRKGTSLLVLPQDPTSADHFAQALAAAGAFQYHGLVGPSRASWMGNWVFVRQHPLYAGLPVNEVMHSDYQQAYVGVDGALVEGPDVEICAAYSRDHDKNIGAATFTAKLGQGRIVFQLVSGMNDLMEQRWLANAVNYLSTKSSDR